MRLGKIIFIGGLSILSALPLVAVHAQTAPATLPATANGAATRPSSTQATLQPGGGITLNFNDVSINAVLDELSSVAGFIIIKKVQPEGRISLLSRQAIPATKVIELLNTVLNERGYAAMQQGQVLRIVTKAESRSMTPIKTVINVEDIPLNDDMITAIIPVRSTDANQLRNDLAQLISADAQWGSNASSNSLIMTDTQANIRRIVEIVRALDSSQIAQASVEVFQLRYASAANTARLINDVFRVDAAQQGGRGGGNQGGGRGGGQGGFGGFGGGGGGGFPGFGGGGGGGNNPLAALFGGGRGAGGRQQVRVQASSDDRTNTVVVTGPPETLATIGRVVRELDANPAADSKVFTYRVKNARAIQLEYVVNNMFGGFGATGGNRGRTTSTAQSQLRTGQRTNQRTSGFGSGTGTTGRGGGGGGFGGGGGGGGFGQNTGRGGGTFAQGGRGGTGGTGGRGGFAGGGRGGLSATGQRAASGIGAGEVYVVAEEDTNSLLVMTNPGLWEDVEQILIELDRPVPQVLIKVLVAEVTHDNGTDLGTEFSILNLGGSASGGAAGDKTDNGSIGTNFGILNAGSGLALRVLETEITATIRALQTQGKLDVLSRPYILASDNQLASITVGQEVPRITGTRITDTGQTINTIEYIDVGILLDVIPHINPDGLVIMDVAPEISALTGTTVLVSDGVEAPVYANRSAQTRVAIRNGQTIVIGGLMEDRRTDTINKVPIAGDIPIIGWLFKREQKKLEKRELLIFLTPHVAPSPDDLTAMSADEQRGTRLVPKAVKPGAFPEHMEGMQRGANVPATQPQ